MKLLTTVIAAGLACASTGCGAASQAPHTNIAGSQCSALVDSERHVAAFYGAGGVDRVERLERQLFIARAIQPQYVAGARLYVPAQHGMSAPYLERVLTCHAASSANVHPNDPLRVANIASIDVSRRGQRFLVTIEGADRTAGREIWQRAQALTDPTTQVGVQQLSALPHPGAL